MDFPNGSTSDETPESRSTTPDFVDDPAALETLLQPGVLRELATELFDATNEPTIDGDADREQTIQWIEGSFHRLATAGQLVAAVVEGQLAGVAGFDRIGNRDGRDVFEIKHSVVLSAFRNQRIWG